MILFQILMSLAAVAGAQASLNTTEYTGSSFEQVLQVLQDQDPSLATPDAKKEYEVYQKGQLPQYEVSFASFARGKATLEQDAKRTVSERFDYYDRLPKKLHSNGVCLTGRWKIDRELPGKEYTGYFKKGAEALFVGRASVAMTATERGEKRGFGFAGKLFPTLDQEQKVETRNFFTVDVLLGTQAPRYLDTAMTNEPEMGMSFSPWVIKLGLFIAKAFSAADESPLFRPITPIAKMGVAPGEGVSSPKWIRVRAAKGQIKNEHADFRRELVQAVLDNSGELDFDIEVSDTTADRQATSGWSRIGQIKMDRALISYGCDRRLHFAHPLHNE